MDQDNDFESGDTQTHTPDDGHNHAENAQSAQSTQSAATEPAAAAATPNASANEGVAEHKLYAILGYVLPFLFFLPLLQESSKNNAFARFHANQQLILLIVVVGLYAIHNVLFIMFMAGGFFVIQLLNLAVLVLAIMGIVHAAQGEMKELPIVGKFRLLK